LNGLSPYYAGLPDKEGNLPFLKKVPQTFVTTYIAPTVSYVLRRINDYF
jgi:hypothetical protein